VAPFWLLPPEAAEWLGDDGIISSSSPGIIMSLTSIFLPSSLLSSFLSPASLLFGFSNEKNLLWFSCSLAIPSFSWPATEKRRKEMKPDLFSIHSWALSVEQQEAEEQGCQSPMYTMVNNLNCFH
jgi:hypothetical protein